MILLFFFFLLLPGESVEVLLEYSTKLLERFLYSWEMLPLMYVILKDARADIEEATRRIAEGKKNPFILIIKIKNKIACMNC